MFDLSIAADGQITAIYSDELVGLLAEGRSEVRRASHVEPLNHEGSTWWCASMVDGPVIGPFRTRQEALDAEVAWLKEKLFA